LLAKNCGGKLIPPRPRKRPQEIELLVERVSRSCRVSGEQGRAPRKKRRDILKNEGERCAPGDDGATFQNIIKDTLVEAYKKGETTAFAKRHGGGAF